MNYLQLINRVKQECAISGQDATDVSGGIGIMARLPNWVNAAYQEILAQHNWAFCWGSYSGTLTASQADYNLDTLTGVSGVGPVLANSVKVNGAYVQFDSDYRALIDAFSGASSAVPTNFTRLPSGLLRFFPTPDSNYSIEFEYYRKSHTLSLSADTPLLPEQWHDVIVYKVMQMYAAYEGAQDVYQYAVAQYTLRLAQMSFDQLPKLDMRKSFALDEYVSNSASSDGLTV